MTLADQKTAARKAAFVRRKDAFANAGPGQSAHLSEVLAGYRGVPLAGYMPIRTEISPLAAMAEASATQNVLTLQEIPADDDLIVTINGTLRESGWSYNATYNQVVPERNCRSYPGQ